MSIKYVCRDCNKNFYCGALRGAKRPYCPYCGDDAATEKCDTYRRHWTTKELKVIEDVINKKITRQTAMKLTGRTYMAVDRQISKMKIILKNL